MKFAVKQNSRAEPAAATKPAPRRSAAQAGFTLAEVLAALVFMAIVIPVAIQGLRIASRAGTVAERRSEAARVAARVLSESLVTTNWNKSTQSGTIIEGTRQFAWVLRNQTWDQDAIQLLTAEVTFSVQNEPHVVRLSTLVENPQ